MEQLTEKKKSSLIDMGTLEKLQAVLPNRYYEEFKTAFKKAYPGKAEKVPARQTVYKVLVGKSTNTKILNVLVAMAEDRAHLKNKLKEALEVC